MGRWKKTKSFAPPALQGFKKKTDAAPVFNFSDHLIDALAQTEERKHEEDVLDGHFNEGFADLDEYGFTLKRRDTSGDIIFRPAEPRAVDHGARHPDDFSDMNAFGEIKIDHVVEAYEPEAEVNEDKETGEKDVVRKSTEPQDRRTRREQAVRRSEGSNKRSQKEKDARGSGRDNVEGWNREADTKNSERTRNGIAGTDKGVSVNGGKGSNVSIRSTESNNKTFNKDSRTSENKTEATLDSQAEVTSESKTSLNSRISVDLDELYKESHLPEKPKPEKKSKKKKKKRNSKAKWDDVVDTEGESPFVRSFRPSGAATVVVAPSGEESTDIDQSKLPQVHSNGHVTTGTGSSEDNQETAASTTKELDIEPLPYDPNNLQQEFARLDDDLLPIAGFPATQIFESNVPRLSAHRLAILGGPYRSSKYKRGPPVERRIVRNSQKESHNEFKKAWKEFEKIVHPTGDIVPAWAKKPTKDNTLKYMLIGVLVFVLAAAISVPIIWLYSGSDDDKDATTLAPHDFNVTEYPASLTNATTS